MVGQNKTIIDDWPMSSPGFVWVATRFPQLPIEKQTQTR